MPGGKRIRENSVFGTVADNPLLAGTSSFNSNQLVLFPSITSDHAIITLDPLRQYENPEIVVVTNHSPASTVATVTRGAYGTTARDHPFGTVWVHALTAEDTLEVLTSATRPADPYQGQLIYEADTNKLVGYGGSDWVPRDAGGQLGYAQAVTSQAGIAGAVDLTDLSVTVTAGAGRRVKITGYIPHFTRTGGTVTFIDLSIFEGATRRTVFVAPIPNSFGGALAQVVLTPGAGGHTYKLQANTDGTVRTDCVASAPGFILVEDIGAA